jgi:AcrR family transcriptional regulator
MERKPGAVRERILDAAVELLRASGVKKLAQPQVARLAGVPQGHLTYYFPRRTDLMMAVAGRTIELLTRELTDFFHSMGWPGAAAPLRLQALALVGFMVKDRARTRMLIGLLQEAQEDEAVHQLLMQRWQRVRALVAGGMGRDPEDPDVEIALATLWGLGIRHLLLGQDADTDRLVARLADWLEHALPPLLPPSRRSGGGLA